MNLSPDRQAKYFWRNTELITYFRPTVIKNHIRAKLLFSGQFNPYHVAVTLCI